MMLPQNCFITAGEVKVPDLCALASCSRFWREICGSDCIWEPLVRERWPPLEFSDGSSSSTAIKKTMSMGWRTFYIEVHHKMAAEATSVVQFVKQCRSSESLEVDEYLGAIELLHAMRFGLEDVEMFLFKPEHTVLLNMIGLHYCIDCLGVPAICVLEALHRSKISERRVCVEWFELGHSSPYPYQNFYIPDESHFRYLSLEDLAMYKGEEVLGLIHEGASDWRIARVKITIADP
ncbi:hypothetical protein CerSpe_039250 [Prunus speciosa]